MMSQAVLIDSCVLMDAHFDFREGHHRARKLFEALAGADVRCYLPVHAYFELVTATVTHFKREPEKLDEDAVRIGLPAALHIVPLTAEYVGQLFRELTASPIPDLKSQDMIYFCIARNLNA